MIRVLTILLLSVLSLNAAIPPFFFRHTGANAPTCDNITTNYTYPLAYYKLDDLSGVDSTPNAKDLTPGPDITSVAGQIGNAVEFAVNGTAGMERADADLDLTGGFTVRFWMKTAASDTLGVIGRRADTLEPGWVANVVEDQLEFLIDQGSGVRVAVRTTNFVVSDDVFHHIVCWHTNGVGIGISVDCDNVFVADTSVGVGSQPELEFQMRLTGIANGIVALDEVAIWGDYVLTSAERDCDCNNGAGRTYPLPSPNLPVSLLENPQNGELLQNPETGEYLQNPEL